MLTKATGRCPACLEDTDDHYFSEGEVSAKGYTCVHCGLEFSVSCNTNAYKVALGFLRRLKEEEKDDS